MTTSQFALLDGIPELVYLSDDIRKHEIDGRPVKAKITYEEQTKFGKFNVQKGNILDQELKKVPIIEETRNGPEVNMKWFLVPVNIKFNIWENKLLQVPNSSDLKVTLKNINYTLPSKTNFKFLKMFIDKINVDYPVQWYGDQDLGRIHAYRSIIYGDDIVKDDLYGGYKYETSSKVDVGITDTIKNLKVNLRVTRNGYFHFPKKYEADYIPNFMEIGEYFMTKMINYTSLDTK